MLTELGKYCFVNLPPAKRPAKTRRWILYRTIRKLPQRLSESRSRPSFLMFAPCAAVAPGLSALVTQ
jgi:hypothetical protein